ncbi:MAG: haloacid dehalogenase type II [Rhodospirillales bacterium]
MRISDFKAMTFDVYGTLIDWEAGLLNELGPWARKHGLMPADGAILEAFAAVESPVQREHPRMAYRDVLAETHRRFAATWGIAADEAAALAFGASISRWPAFPDSAAALGYLKGHFTLAALSNVDDASIEPSLEKLGRPFHHVFTAQQIGSYKPDRRNFEYAIAKLAALGIAKKDILHVAQSLYHDHVPAQALGMTSAWIDRRAGKPGAGATAPLANPPKVQFRFKTMAALADRHRAEGGR